MKKGLMTKAMQVRIRLALKLNNVDEMRTILRIFSRAIDAKNLYHREYHKSKKQE